MGHGRSAVVGERSEVELLSCDVELVVFSKVEAAGVTGGLDVVAEGDADSKFKRPLRFARLIRARSAAPQVVSTNAVSDSRRRRHNELVPRNSAIFFIPMG